MFEAELTFVQLWASCNVTCLLVQRKLIVQRDRPILPSAIGCRLQEIDHSIDPECAFTIILRDHNRKLLAIYEAILIRLHNPGLFTRQPLSIIVHVPCS